MTIISFKYNPVKDMVSMKSVELIVKNQRFELSIVFTFENSPLGYELKRGNFDFESE